MKRLIVTIAEGPKINWGHIVIPKMYAYARKCSADFQVLTGATFGNVWDHTHNCQAHPSWNKLLLISWFSRQSVYDRMLFLDADIYVPGKADDVFEACPDSGMFMARDMFSERELPGWKEWAKARYPEAVVPERHEYKNGGVFLLDVPTAIEMRILFEKFPEHYDQWLEQGYVQLMLAQTDKGRDMPERFNAPIPFMTNRLGDACFWHQNGVNNEDRLGYFEKMAKAEKEGRSKL